MGRPKREFCTDTFRMIIRKPRAHDVYTPTDYNTTPDEPLYMYVIVTVILEFQKLSNWNTLSLRDTVRQRSQLESQLSGKCDVIRNRM